MRWRLFDNEKVKMSSTSHFIYFHFKYLLILMRLFSQSQGRDQASLGIAETSDIWLEKQKEENDCVRTWKNTKWLDYKYMKSLYKALWRIFKDPLGWQPWFVLKISWSILSLNTCENIEFIFGWLILNYYNCFWLREWWK